jgi:hypothetical protein
MKTQYIKAINFLIAITGFMHPAFFTGIGMLAAIHVATYAKAQFQVIVLWLAIIYMIPDHSCILSHPIFRA